jgi:hypothetical protein
MRHNVLLPVPKHHPLIRPQPTQLHRQRNGGHKRNRPNGRGSNRNDPGGTTQIMHANRIGRRRRRRRTGGGADELRGPLELRWPLKPTGALEPGAHQKTANMARKGGGVDGNRVST